MKSISLFVVVFGVVQAAFVTIGSAVDLSGNWEQRLIEQEFREGVYNYYADTGEITVNSAGHFTNCVSSLPVVESWDEVGTITYTGNGIVRVDAYETDDPSDTFQVHLPINSAMDCMLSVQWELDGGGGLEDVSVVGLVKSPSSSTVSDLAGQWQQFGMFVERDGAGSWFAEWEKTQNGGWLTIDSDGNFSMPLMDSGGWAGVETGQLVQTAAPGVYGLSDETDMNLALNASKDLLVRGLYATEDQEDEFSFILYLKKGSSYQLSDLAGRWNLSSAYYVKGELRGETGVMTIATNGTLSGNFTDWDGEQESLSGTVSIDSQGFVTFSASRADDEGAFSWWDGVKFFLNAGKSVLAGCWTDDDELLMDFAVKAPDVPSSDIPQWWLNQYSITNALPHSTCSNGVNTVMEAYIAALNPNDPQSRLYASLSSNSTLDWNPATSGRVYSVYFATNLMSSFQCIESNLPWTQGGYTNQTDTPVGYYKVFVQLEE